MCIFCKIINNEIPSKKIYEDEDTIAILDISQATKGHTLVIPKKHFDNFLEIDEDTLLKVMKSVKKVTNLLKEKLEVTDFNILNNCGAIAYQSVMHLHIHIIPRYNDDNFSIAMNDNSKDIDLNEIYNKIID